MHTVIVLAIGFAAFAFCFLLGRVLGGSSGAATASLVFLPLWLIGAGLNMYLGVKRAGYTVADEAPVFLIVFALPAGVALLTWWRFR